jgi:hypothetical protein
MQINLTDDELVMVMSGLHMLRDNLESDAVYNMANPAECKAANDLIEKLALLANEQAE